MINALRKYYWLFKYLVSGGSAAAVSLGTLYLLTEYAHFHYLLSAILAFIVAFFVSFLLQKFWTFQNKGREDMHVQLAAFLLVSLGNLALNTLLIYTFVEVFHLWYLLAAFISGGFIAVESFFIYRYVIFVEGVRSEKLHPFIMWMQCHAIVLLACAAMALTVFLASYKLTESPPTWLDEGIITQVAMNAARHEPRAVLQTAPAHLVSAGYVSTSYPVTYPIAASFALFGVGLLQAREVMVLFLIGFVLLVYAYLKREMSPWQALAGLFLIASFAPLYGNGKNVLGEVPGLFFLLLLLLWIKRIEARETTYLDFMGAGLMLGLVVVTKPIFLLLLPVIGIVFLFSLRLCTAQKAAAAIAGFIAPVWLWLIVQFNGETLGGMLAIYANPHGNDLASSVAHNALGFVTQPQPLYAALLLGAWLLSLGTRLRRKQSISRAEYIAIGFTTLVYLAYLRGAEYYRYFFLGEVFALMYLPKALGTLWHKKVPAYLLAVSLSLLVSFQIYQSFFSSWVAEHYASHRSRDLGALTAGLGAKSVFIYQAPEAVLFLPKNTAYYQYIDITPAIKVGRDYLPLITRGVPDVIISPSETPGKINFSHYTERMTADKYTLWFRKTSSL